MSKLFESWSWRCWLPPMARFHADSPWRKLWTRANRQSQAPASYLDRLAALFSTQGDRLPAAALTREYWRRDAGSAGWLSADPAWVQPDLNGARLLACGQMQLTQHDADVLAQALRPVFDEFGLRLYPTMPDRWHIRLPDGMVLPPFVAPDQAMGENLLGHLPAGEHGRRWRVLTNEVQIVLHQQPLNRARAARGLPPVNSLWLWGGGALPAQLAAQLNGVLSDDPLVQALASFTGIKLQGCNLAALSQTGAGWLFDLQTMSISDLDAHWWPALQPWIRRRSIELTFAGAERGMHKPLHRLRFWRAARSAESID